MRFLLFCSLIIFSIVNTFAQCSMCKATLETDDTPVGNGINAGILFLMPIPYIIMSVIAFIMYRKYKANRVSNE